MEERVPIGVWIFWSLVGLAIIIALFRWATGGNTPTYIAPIAACVSAMAATYTVYMTTKTFRQARLDRKEELEARHPRFNLTKCCVRWGDQGSSCELGLTFENANEHAAKGLLLTGRVHLGVDSQPLCGFECGSDERYVDHGSDFTTNPYLINVSDSSIPYYVRLQLSYCDARTGKLYSDTYYRKFNFRSDCFSDPLEEVDLSEYRNQLLERQDDKHGLRLIVDNMDFKS
jgi:hypothetical protein